MKIYHRDYSVLTDTEEAELKKILLKEEVHKLGDLVIRKNLIREYPKAARHSVSLFPNNYLDFVDLERKEELNLSTNLFLDNLDSGLIKNEQDVLGFIKNNQAYFIIGSIFNYYNFGHHEAYIFPEFTLGSKYRVDYLLIGKNSDGYSFIFVELEHPIKDITLLDGELGQAYRKGIIQTKEWKSWLFSNYSNVSDTLKKYKNSQTSLPEEFFILDPTRFNYVVVAGRRDNINERTRRIRREHLQEQQILLLHYDNLIDSAKAIIHQGNY